MDKKNQTAFYADEHETNLQQLDDHREYCLAFYKEMREIVTDFLMRKAYEELSEAFPCFEEPEKYPEFHHIGETRKLHVILSALKLELKLNKTPFVALAESFDDLLSLYQMCVFAFRRLELCLSDASLEEAASFLAPLPISIYFAMAVIENERFENHTRLSWNLYELKKVDWSESEQIQFLNYYMNKSEAGVHA